MNILNKCLKLKKITNPYNIWIIDNCFDTDTISQINTNWSYDLKDWYQTRDLINNSKNILEHGIFGINDPELMPSFIKEFLQKIHTQKFIDDLVHILSIEPLIVDSHMRWSGMRYMNNGSFQLIHSDARKHSETGYIKHLTCLLYLNECYNKSRDEGCLEIWDDRMKKCCYEIEPISNRLVVFENSNTSYHGVPCVKSERRMLMWSVLKKEKSLNRTKALFVRRPGDPVGIDSVALNRLNEKDITR